MNRAIPHAMTPAITRGILVLTSLCLAGCSFLAAKPDRTRNYLLTEQVVAAAAQHPPIAIAIGPISLPAYLDRAEFVVRVPPNTIQLSPLDRWAEPLRDNFARVFAADLAAAAGADNVLEFPWYGKPEVDYRVTIDVEQFEQRSDGVAVLVARWRLRRGVDGPTVRIHRSRHEVRIDGAAVEDAVEALSRATALLAEEIAASIPR